MLGMVIAQLAQVEEWMHDTETVDNVRPVPWRTCPNGCGCRWGTMDADARECACNGPCCGSDDDVWFDKPYNELGDLIVGALITLLNYTHDEARVGAVVIDRTKAAMENMAKAKTVRRRLSMAATSSIHVRDCNCQVCASI